MVSDIGFLYSCIFLSRIVFFSSDVNECELQTDECNHHCINTEGSYNCKCNIGYLLQDNRRTCVKCKLLHTSPLQLLLILILNQIFWNLCIIRIQPALTIINLQQTYFVNSQFLLIQVINLFHCLYLISLQPL